MFCPECRSEYVAGVEVCADCGARLVAELPADPSPEVVEYEPVLSTPSPGEIAVIKSLLEEAGIDCRSSAEIAGPPLGLPATILVPKERAAEAKDILDAYIAAGMAVSRGEEGAEEDSGDPSASLPRPGEIRAVLLDFGGVIAEEGFRLGLEAIALRNDVEPASLYREAEEAIYDTGYITGRGTEADFWERLRRRTGIEGADDALADEILRRFVVRPGMIAAVRALRRQGILVAILSDQTDWLERLDARDRFFLEFDRVFNSYRVGKGKRDATVFDDVVRGLGVAPAEALFVDDNPGHVERARSRGLSALLFRTVDAFLTELSAWTGS